MNQLVKNSAMASVATAFVLGPCVGCEQDDFENPYNAPTAPVIDEPGLGEVPGETVERDSIETSR